MSNSKEEKHDICKRLGIQLLIDDSLSNGKKCAENGIKVLLFTYNNTYTWSTIFTSNPNIQIVENWRDVEGALYSFYFLCSIK